MSSKSKKFNGLTSTFLLIVALIFIAFLTVSQHGDLSTPLDIRAVPVETFKQFPKSPIKSDALSSSGSGSSRIQSSDNNNITRNTTRLKSNSKNNNKQKSFDLHFIHIPKCGGMYHMHSEYLFAEI